MVKDFVANTSYFINTGSAPAENEARGSSKLSYEKGKAMKPMAIFVKTGGRVAKPLSKKPLSKLACLLLAGGLLSTAGGAAAKAQMINPFGGYHGPTLKQDDYNLAGDVVTRLLNEKPAQVGHYEDWSNPASGNQGKFTILSIFTSKNMPCRKVKAEVIYAKTGSNPRSFTLDACQLPTGEWKTVT
jgi:surface antigen